MLRIANRRINRKAETLFVYVHARVIPWTNPRGRRLKRERCRETVARLIKPSPYRVTRGVRVLRSIRYYTVSIRKHNVNVNRIRRNYKEQYSLEPTLYASCSGTGRSGRDR